MRLERGNTSRPPAVAGLFYPDDARELRDVVSEYLRQHSSAIPVAPPKALIVPHAGYIYSGGIAAAAYATVASLRRVIRRVVLIEDNLIAVVFALRVEFLKRPHSGCPILCAVTVGSVGFAGSAHDVADPPHAVREILPRHR